MQSRIVGNVISNNAQAGIHIGAVSPSFEENEYRNLLIEDNLIGLNPAGTSAMGNGTNSPSNDVDYDGIYIHNPRGVKIHENVISGNQGNGIWINDVDDSFGASATKIWGNLIGTDITGEEAIPNGRNGVQIGNSSDFTVHGNVSSGNDANGIELDNSGSGSSGIYIFENLIGVEIDGVSAMGNGANGVFLNVRSTNNLIEQNTIAFNGTNEEADGRAGVYVLDDDVYTNLTTTNRLTKNSVYSNAGLGIDLAPDEDVTPNDSGDSDPGANHLQNFPVLESAVQHPNTHVIYVKGSLNSTASTTFVLEFFINDPSDPNEGQSFVSTDDEPFEVTTDGTGNVSFTAHLLHSQNKFEFRVTATATKTAAYGSLTVGDTSEFSAATQVWILGDMNGDGETNNLDIAPFSLALSDPATYASQYPGIPYTLVGDINMDGAFNNLDIQPFADLLTDSFLIGGPGWSQLRREVWLSLTHNLARFGWAQDVDAVWEELGKLGIDFDWM